MSLDWQAVLQHGAALARAADLEALQAGLRAFAGVLAEGATARLELGEEAAGVAVVDGENRLGSLTVEGLVAPSPEIAAALAFAAQQAAAALSAQANVARLRERERQLDRKVLDLQNLFAIASEVNASLRAGQIAKVMLLNALGLAMVSKGAVAFFKGQAYILLASRGMASGAPLEPPAFPPGVSTVVAENGDLYLGLLSHGKLLGFMMLGARANRPYQFTELEYFRAIADHGATALENANSYQKIGEMNVSLEAMVQKRTAELEKALKELKRTQAQLVQSEKMASLGQMVAGVAHELNNPLTFIHGNLKVLGTYLKDLAALLALVDAQAAPEQVARLKAEIDYAYLLEDLPRTVESALNGTVRSQKIVDDLKLFAGHDEADLKPVDLKSGLESTVALVQGRFPDRVSFELDLAELPAVTALGKQLNQAFLALVTNACQAIEGEGTVSLRLAQEADQAVITIRDTGCGIPEAHLPRIFDPFFTTRAVGEGTGLGLTTAYSVIERHQGKLFVRSRPGEGTTATVRIPLI